MFGENVGAQMLKRYGFRIRTKSGLVIDNLLIPGRSRDEAERKVRQIYLGCVVIACVVPDSGMAIERDDAGEAMVIPLRAGAQR